MKGAMFCTGTAKKTLGTFRPNMHTGIEKV